MYGNAPVELCQPGRSAAGSVVHEICNLLLLTSWNTLPATDPPGWQKIQRHTLSL